MKNIDINSGNILIFGDEGTGKSKYIKEIIKDKKVLGIWGEPSYEEFTKNLIQDGDETAKMLSETKILGRTSN